MGHPVLSNDISTAKTNLLSATHSISSLSTHLSSSALAFVEVSERIEERFRVLEKKEMQLLDWEEGLKKKEVDVDEKEKEVERRTIKVIERERRLLQKEVEMQDREMKLDFTNTVKLPSLVKFNIGGKRFIVPRATVLKFKGSYFESRLLETYLTEKEMKIDRDSQLFEMVINYLKHEKIPRLEEDENDTLKSEFEFYRIPFPNPPPLPSCSGVGTLLNESTLKVINEWLPNTSFQLIYQGSTNGFKAENFHDACDNQGPTLTLIQSKQEKKGEGLLMGENNERYVFGGYSPLSWDSSNSFKSHPSTFIFSLSNPFSLPPTQYFHSLPKYDASSSSTSSFSSSSSSSSSLPSPPLSPQSPPLSPSSPSSPSYSSSLPPSLLAPLYSIYCGKDSGVVFGLGSDIWVKGKVNQNNEKEKESKINFPCSFVDTTWKGRETFTGGKDFLVAEIEIYKCIINN